MLTWPKRALLLFHHHTRAETRDLVSLCIFLFIVAFQLPAVAHANHVTYEC
jgi:hypothetical protein